ncbi:FAD-binding oxidoreductase [Tritonibacter horizontis]|uniref:Flavohemoprotein n=1 Tax=Tritonibacter horizontis TaxID=1768241 RepID=A0A132BSP9_9RHOB|nr:pyridoxamine 5'-phosphate oxidase family protein [Tritonibacter horizontis]KUP90780.1 flavohemoprotein [Tritonibacter horizontis]
MTRPETPFHEGEIIAQGRAGVARQAATSSRFIRDHMPDQHRMFFESLPFLVVAGADTSGARWVSMLETQDGDVASPSAQLLTLPAGLGAADPLAPGFVPGAALGILGIDLATRRRNRVNGQLRATETGLALSVTQSFGNCPQYIHERDWVRADEPADRRPPPRTDRDLSEPQKRWIASADTLFIGSGLGDAGRASFDASHRGGKPGFVEIAGPRSLRMPDYTGNNFFNTIGNLLQDPRVGLLFVDFATGGLLHLTGRAQILWDGTGSADPQARREILITIDRVVERPHALSLRWRTDAAANRTLRITRKDIESSDITSFHLEPEDGRALAPFLPGQYLPVVVGAPDQSIGQATNTSDSVQRTYTLSGPVSPRAYRISVKREAQGRVSKFLHDQTETGDLINAGAPSGDFTLPNGDTPLVLVSAGVGVTPMLAMFHAVVAAQSNRRVWFLQGVRNGAAHAFRGEVAQLAARALNATVRTFYSTPRPEDRPLPINVTEGRMTVDDLMALRAGPEAHYMICGPAEFIAGLTEVLEQRGIRPDQIRHETFGPTA